MKKLCIVILSLTAAVSCFAQTKTVTNGDLEKFRQQRVESERKLKERYAELGFPSPEQIEKQNAARRARMEQYSDELRRRRVESQNEIIAEANELRAQLAAVDAQINYLRGRGGSAYNSGFVYSYGYAPYGFRRGNRSVLPQLRNLPPNARTVQEYAIMYPNSQTIYRQSTGNVGIGGRVGNVGGGIGFGGRPNYGGNRYYRGGAIAPIIVGGSYNSNDAGQDLIFLEQQRAGLLAQWNLLAEEARRAGIRLD